MLSAPQFQSRGLVKASGKSSFTTFVDLGMYQSPGGTGDNISVSSESTLSLEFSEKSLNQFVGVSFFCCCCCNEASLLGVLLDCV